MHDEYSKRAYSGTVSAIAVPILVNGVAVAALNMMYLRDMINAKEAAQKFLCPLNAAAQEIAKAFPSLAATRRLPAQE